MTHLAITSIQQLEEIYQQPSELVQKKQLSEIDNFCHQYLELSPFIVLSSADKNGQQDCSPRGDPCGFLHILDSKTIALPDRPGNNRIDSLRNIVENPNVGLLAMIPGFKECVRINGSAIVTIDPELMSKFVVNGKSPRSVIVITVIEIFFHCAKAITRAKLWDIDSQVPRDKLPSLGRIVMQQAYPDASETDIKKTEQTISERTKTTLY